MREVEAFLSLMMTKAVETTVLYTAMTKGVSITKDEVYDESFIKMPRIYCKDGFSISIQIGCGHYCASENGYRKYGKHWEMVEWGFPSEPIDPFKYDCDDKEGDTTNSIGRCDIELIEDLIAEHQGIDLCRMCFF